MEKYGRGWFIARNIEDTKRVPEGIEDLGLYDLYTSKDLREDKIIVRIDENVFQTIPKEYFLMESKKYYLGEINGTPIVKKDQPIYIRILRLRDGAPIPITKRIVPVFAERCGFSMWEVVDVYGNRYFLIDVYSDCDNLELPIDHVGMSDFGNIPYKGSSFVFNSIISYPTLVKSTFIRMINPIFIECIVSTEEIGPYFYKISGIGCPLFGSHKEYIEVVVSTLS